jgi:DNA polymerase/3'-5' exonuclease PolX
MRFCPRASELDTLVMPITDASQVAGLLKEFGSRALLYGGNPYRAKAYLRAAERVALLTEPLDDLVVQQRLQDIPGVGDAIAGVITQLCQTGSHPSLEKMRADIPESVLEMLTIPGLRPDKVMRLHKELGINTIEELETAVKEDRLKSVKGLGPALQRKILAGLEARQSAGAARHVHRAAELLSAAEASLKRSNLNLKKIVIAGDLRRGCELVSNLALAAEQPGAKTVRLKFGERAVPGRETRCRSNRGRNLRDSGIAIYRTRASGRTGRDGSCKEEAATQARARARYSRHLTCTHQCIRWSE